MPSRIVSRGRGFRRYVRVPAKTRALPARAPAGLIVPASLASEGPRVERRASCAQKRGSASLFALGSRGPVWSGGGPQDQPRQRARAWMRASSAKAQGRASPNPAGPPRTRRRRARSSGCPSLWLLSLGQARESDSAPAEGDETSRQRHARRVNPPAVAEQRKSEKPRSKWIPAFAGMTSYGRKARIGSQLSPGRLALEHRPELDPGSGEARPVLILSQGRGDGR